VINPVSFLALVMLEHALKNQPDNLEFKMILLKTYSKLGALSKVIQISDSLKSIDHK
jgi:hypothetical protein